MARKEASFGQLVDYVMREASDADFTIHHNLLGRSRDEIVAEFEDNAKLLRKRKNGNVMYHEILSITRPAALADAAQKEALRGIAERYITARAPDCLVLGAMHDDHDDHLHYHVVMSANPFGMAKRHTLSKAQFRDIGVKLERRAMARYPELEQTVAIEKSAAIKLTKNAAALKAQTGRLPKNEALAAELMALFGAVDSIADLKSAMSAKGYAFYQRGKSTGIVNLETGKKHRVATLGIADAYEAMKDRLSPREDDLRNAPEHKRTHQDSPPTTGTADKENDMVDLASLLQGVGALSDLLSIAGTPTPAADDQSTQQATGDTRAEVKQDQKKADREIIAEARRAEIEKLRKEREKTRSKTLTRRR